MLRPPRALSRRLNALARRQPYHHKPSPLNSAIASQLRIPSRHYRPPTLPSSVARQCDAAIDGSWTQEPETDAWYQFLPNIGSTPLGSPAMRCHFMLGADADDGDGDGDCASMRVGAVASALFERAHAWRLALALATHGPAATASASSAGLHTDPLKLATHIGHSIRKIAEFLNANRHHITLVPSATAHDALRSVLAEEMDLLGDDGVVLAIEGLLPGLRSVLEAECGRVGASLVLVDVGSALLHGEGDSAVIEAVRRHVLTSDVLIDCDYRGGGGGGGGEGGEGGEGSEGGEGGRGMLAVFEHVSHHTCVTMPISAMAHAVKEYAPMARVVVDGSASLGGHDIDLGGEQTARGESGWGRTDCVDVFVSDCHRSQLGATDAVAVVWRSQQIGDCMGNDDNTDKATAGAGVVPPVMIPHCAVPDFTSALTIPLTLDFWRTVGFRRARDHCRVRLVEGVETCGAAWHDDTDSAEQGEPYHSSSSTTTSTSTTSSSAALVAPLSMNANVALVALPPQAHIFPPHINMINMRVASSDCSPTPPVADETHPPALTSEALEAAAGAWEAALAQQYGIVHCPIVVYDHRLWVKVSSHVYTDANDYEVLAHACRSIADAAEEEHRRRQTIEHARDGASGGPLAAVIYRSEEGNGPAMYVYVEEGNEEEGLRSLPLSLAMMLEPLEPVQGIRIDLSEPRQLPQGTTDSIRQRIARKGYFVSRGGGDVV